MFVHCRAANENHDHDNIYQISVEYIHLCMKAKDYRYDNYNDIIMLMSIHLNMKDKTRKIVPTVIPNAQST